MPLIAAQPLSQLLTQRPGWALGLHGYGITLFNHAGYSLQDCCKQMGLAPAQVLATLEARDRLAAEAPPVADLPIRLVMEYLRHAHQVFIRERLPFLLYLTGGLEQQCPRHRSLAQDLKLVFPLFAEDFIQHIHEEEDSLFAYIAQLELASRRMANPGQTYFLLERHSIAEFSAGHEVHDDEMEGIRALTNGYDTDETMELPLRVLYHELARLEQDLVAHAAIENRILFPKALRLEGYVRKVIEGVGRFN